MSSHTSRILAQRSKSRQIPVKKKQSSAAATSLPSSAGKKRAALADVTNRFSAKHPAYEKQSKVPPEPGDCSMGGHSLSSSYSGGSSLDLLECFPAVWSGHSFDDAESMAMSPATSSSNLDVSMRDPVQDVDESEDPTLSCSDYTREIFVYLREAEMRFRPNACYMSKQPDISSNMRSILMEWLVEVADEYKLEQQTLYLAVSYVDRFLSAMSVTRSKLQLLGTAAIYLAAKLEEIYPPELKDFVYITDDTYNKKQVIKMEQIMLNCLQFNLVVPTAYNFLVRCLKAAEADEVVAKLAQYLCELTLLWDVPFLKHLPSAIAASCVCMSLHTLGRNAWPTTLAQYSQYSVCDIRDCIQDIHTMFCQAPKSPRQAIRDKYKAEKHFRVSLLTPPGMLPF